MNCLIIDDEPLAIDVIKEYVNRIPYLNLEGETTSAFEAIEIIDQQHIDLVFLDIQMPELTGIELLKSLSKVPMVIFTTAYPDYALDSYEFDAIDYLVKPVSFERFLKAVNKAKGRKGQVNDVVLKEDNSADYIFVKTEYKTVKISLSDILYIESVREYVKFYMKGSEITSLLSMAKIEKTLPQNRFVRVHRSFIISVEKIVEIERNTIVINQERIPVGTNYREVFKQVIDEFRLK